MSFSLATLSLTGYGMRCQRCSNSTEVGIKGAAMRRKCIFLLLSAKEHSMEIVGIVEKSVDTKLLNARSATGIWMVDIAQTTATGVILKMVAPTRYANSVE